MPSIATNLPISEIDEVIDLAIREDLGRQYIDITTRAIIRQPTTIGAKVYLKEQAVLAGLSVFEYVLSRFDRKIQVDLTAADGEYCAHQPVVIAQISGPAEAVLSSERLALNLLQRLSGIATLTRKFVDLASPYNIQIRDTRKTTPGLRIFERQAVALGGGQNHRFGLFDAILIKDNHIQIAGGIQNAIARVKEFAPDLSIQVETSSLEEVRQAASSAVDAILLDNMSPEMVRQAVDIIDRRSFVEVSGGINLANVQSYLLAGVNAISVGALTHSAPSIDISLEVEI